MTMKRWDGTASVDLATAERWDGTAFVPLTVAKRWDGVAFVAMTLPGGGGSLSATGDVNPATTEFVEFDDLVTTVTSYQVTITPSGGTGPYTYAWSYVSGHLAINSTLPTAAATRFTADIYRGTSRSAVWRCTVTDSLAATATVDIQVNLTR